MSESLEIVHAITMFLADRAARSRSMKGRLTMRICTFDPTKVPKAVEVITPSGVAQSTELDYMLRPVALQGVTIP